MGETLFWPGGGSGSGGTLAVTAPVGTTVIATNAALGKTISKAVNAEGIAVLKGLKTGTWLLSCTDGDVTSTPVPVEIVADYTKTLAFFSATINVTYPVGSTVTCTCGTVQLVSTQIEDANGSATFCVPNAGTWTVTATANDGSGDTANKAVEITAEGQSVNVELSYRYYLYNNGVAAFDFGWGSGGQGAVSFNDDHILINTNSYPTWITTKAMINRGEFTKLGITCVLSDSPGAGVRFGFSNSNSDIHSNIESKFIASTTITESGEQTAYADLSSVSESAYIVVMSAWDSGTSSVKAIWLE